VWTTDSTTDGLGSAWVKIKQYIHLYSHKLQLQKEDIKKHKGKRKTQRVKEHNVSNAY